jgi:hypothetical protein
VKLSLIVFAHAATAYWWFCCWATIAVARGPAWIGTWAACRQLLDLLPHAPAQHPLISLLVLPPGTNCGVPDFCCPLAPGSLPHPPVCLVFALGHHHCWGDTRGHHGVACCLGSCCCSLGLRGCVQSVLRGSMVEQQLLLGDMPECCCGSSVICQHCCWNDVAGRFASCL